MTYQKKSVPTEKKFFASKRNQSKILKGTYLTFKEYKLLEMALEKCVWIFHTS